MDDESPATAPDTAPISPAGQTLLAFASDDATLKTIAGVSPGLKRGTDLFEGGIALAIETVQSGVRPTLLIVDVSDTDSPIAPMTALLAAVDPSCTVVALGARNDITLYRNLVSIGVTDYLVKPIESQDLRRSLLVAETTETRSDMQANGRLITVSGIRGGAGGSAVALGIAQHLAHGGRRQVALVDLDVYFGTLALTLDLEPGRGLRNALEHPDRIDSLFVASALVNVTDSLFVLGSEEPLDDLIYIQPEAILSLVEELRRIFDLVVVDLPRHLLPYSHAIHEAADSAALVTDLSLAGLRDSMRARDLVVKAVPSLSPMIIGNRIGLAKHSELEADEFAKTLGAPLDAMFAEDPKAAKDLMQGKAFDPKAVKSKSMLTMDSLARRLAGMESDSKSENKGWLPRKMAEAAKIPRLSRAG